MRDTGGRDGGVSGNDFHGPAAAQSGNNNTQHNYYVEPPRGDRRRPRLIVAALLVLAVIGGAGWWLVDSGNGGSPGSTGKGTSSAGSTSPRPASGEPGASSEAAQDAEAPAPSASLSSSAAGIQWTGTVRINEEGLRLDKKPPERTPGYSADVQLGLVEPPRLTGSASGFALWPERRMPTRQECSDLASTQGVEQLEVTKGAVVCLTTIEGRTAVLTITSVSNNFNTGVMAQASVWSKPDQ
ncbi:hypothetical protein ABT381_03300 [Streptomyces sp. NPDC000151]|uniref:hypothetical protein n=1 Tax=Streptomyces sp. NPDC000151 TaxID=3154244 RepID=UPI003320157F